MSTATPEGGGTTGGTRTGAAIGDTPGGTATATGGATTGAAIGGTPGSTTTTGAAVGAAATGGTTTGAAVGGAAIGGATTGAAVGGTPGSTTTTGAAVGAAATGAAIGGATTGWAAGAATTGRRVPVIRNETTGPIPVHLLFRDDGEAGPGAVDTGPVTVVRGRAPGGARPAGEGATSPGGPAAGAVRVPGPARRTVPPADAEPAERPGPVLPGWAGVAAGAVALAGCAALLWWTGAVPPVVAVMLGLPSRPYNGIGLGVWALLAVGVLGVLFSFGGLCRGRVGYAWVLTLFGDYRGSVRRTGLMWVSPLLLRRRIDVRLRHWRSEPIPAVDAHGTALRVVVLVVWRIRDTVRAALGVADHERYLREQVEAAMARVLSRLPADAAPVPGGGTPIHEDAPMTLRDAEVVGEALTRMLSAECAPVGIDVFSAQPTRIEYAPEIAAAMQRRRVAAIDAKHRDAVLTSVVDAVDDMVHRLTTRGLVELDDYDRKALVKDLTVAFYTGRSGPVEGP
ncbi:SPFH domain-containing protein [Streptomyces lavendofoliae]|uniref:SPFH domain-containing protein n=1 Tax=Streptomyces lavendofoliae TaxID=67314 RepID=UPI003D8B9CF4